MSEGEVEHSPLQLAKPMTIEKPIEAARIKDILIDAGLQKSFPLKPIRELLPAERLKAVDESSGYRDQRGEMLVNHIPFTPQSGQLDLVFIGNAHIPLLASKAHECGRSVLLTSSLLGENLQNYNNNDPDQINGLEILLNHAKKYNFQEDQPTEGYPLVIIGDSHTREYRMNLPSLERIQKAGIEKVNLYAEGIHEDLRGERAKEVLKEGAYLKQRNLSPYLQQLESAGISTEVIGIDPAGYGNIVSDVKEISTESKSTPIDIAPNARVNEIITQRGKNIRDFSSVDSLKIWLQEEINLYSKLGYTDRAQSYQSALDELSQLK